MKVKLKDFQILKGEHEFEFPTGITVIQGESASGKSSLFYAIKDCLTNPSGVDYSINWDAKQTEVTIENNGQSVTWIKTPTSSEYRNNKTGESFIKASKLDSRNIGDLGFYFDHKDNVVNIHDEWSVLFPFGLSDTEMFKQFEAIFNIACAYQIVDDIKKDEQIVKNEISNLSTKINEYNQKQTQISTILEGVNKEEVDNYINILTQKQQVINQMTVDFNNLSKINTLLTLVVPQEFDMTILVDKDNYCNSIKKDYDNYQVNQLLCDAVVPEEFNLDVSKYEELFRDYNSCKQLKDSIQQYMGQLNDLDGQKQQIEEQISQIKVCPTCGRPLE